jgi:hypothetical protein
LADKLMLSFCLEQAPTADAVAQLHGSALFTETITCCAVCIADASQHIMPHDVPPFTVHATPCAALHEAAS